MAKEEEEKVPSPGCEYKYREAYEKEKEIMASIISRAWVGSKPLSDVKNISLLGTTASILRTLNDILVGDKLGKNTRDVVCRAVHIVKWFMNQVKEVRENIIKFAEKIEHESDEGYRKMHLSYIMRLADKLASGGDGTYREVEGFDFMTKRSALYWLAELRAELSLAMTNYGEIVEDVQRIEHMIQDLKVKILYVYARLYCIAGRLLTKFDGHNAKLIAGELRELAQHLV